MLNWFAVAGCAVWFYFGKLIWPADLCFVYPRWQYDDASVLWYLPGLLLVVLIGLASRRRQTWGRPVIMLMVCYVALLLPALGFTNIFFMRFSLVADHWQYAAMIVPCAGFASFVLRPSAFGLRPSASVLRVAGLAILVVLARLTWLQAGVYKDSPTLWADTLAKNPSCWMAHYNFGNIFTVRGNADEAISHYRQALKNNPDLELAALAHNNLAILLVSREHLDRGQLEEAINHYKKALEINPDYVEAHNNLGNALVRQGQGEADASVRRRLGDEALAHFHKALEIKPDYVDA